MEEDQFILCDYSQQIKQKDPIYCIKFCPFLDEHIFAAAILNRIEIHKIKDGKMELVKNIKSDESREYFYTLDWSINRKTENIMLVAGGATGYLFSAMNYSNFGNERAGSSINDIKFSPSIEYLLAVAYEDGFICLYNVQTEVLLAIFDIIRTEDLKQSISISFSSSGEYMAFCGMTKEIFIANLRDNQAFQNVLAKSMTMEEEVVPENFNLFHNVCVIRDLHKNYIDDIFWFADNSFISKSCSGDINFWYIEGIDDQLVPFVTHHSLKVVKQNTLNIKNCDLWFMKFSVNAQLNYLSIGTSNGAICLWNLQGNSFSDWKCQILNNHFSEATVRHSTFSTDGKFLVCCTDDGFMAIYKQYDPNTDGDLTRLNAVTKPSKPAKKARKKSKRY